MDIRGIEAQTMLLSDMLGTAHLILDRCAVSALQGCAACHTRLTGGGAGGGRGGVGGYCGAAHGWDWAVRQLCFTADASGAVGSTGCVAKVCCSWHALDSQGLAGWAAGWGAAGARVAEGWAGRAAAYGRFANREQGLFCTKQRPLKASAQLAELLQAGSFSDRRFRTCWQLTPLTFAYGGRGGGLGG